MCSLTVECVLLSAIVSGFDVHTHPQGAGGKKIALASRKVLEQKRKRKKTMALGK
jgi:hypothetical protein